MVVTVTCKEEGLKLVAGKLRTSERTPAPTQCLDPTQDGEAWFCECARDINGVSWFEFLSCLSPSTLTATDGTALVL